MKPRFTLVAFTLLLILLSMNVGAIGFNFLQLWQWLTRSLPDESARYILSDLRLPRTLTCLAVGGSLSLAGTLLQRLLDNPLAEPYTLGLSGGATLGSFIALLLGLTPMWLMMPLGSFIGCATVTFLILLLLKQMTVFQTRSLVLIGLMISLFCGSMLVVLMSLLEPQNLHSAIQWTLGYCGTERDQWWPATFATLLLCLIWCALRHKSLDALLLGENLAPTLGVPLTSLRRSIVLCVAILTTVSVGQMGLVGFIGLLSPHISERLAKSRRLKNTIVDTVFVGGSLLLAADVLGRIIGGEREIPAGSLVALIGAPALATMLFRRFPHA